MAQRPVCRRSSRLLLTVCFSFIVLLAAVLSMSGRADPLATLPKSPPRSLPIDVFAEVIPSLGRLGSGKATYGKLDWVGGLKLSSDAEAFGGFSGLVFLDESRFLAVSDRGTALSASLRLQDGKPTGVWDASMRSLPGIGPEVAQWRRDAEGLAMRDGKVCVSFEGDTRVVCYALEGGMPVRIAERVPLDASIDAANRGNRGLEAIATIPDTGPYGGGFALLSELPVNGEVLGWIVWDGRSEAFRLPQSDGLMVSDAAFTARGDLIILERNFSLLGGLVVQIRRVRAGDFKPGVIRNAELLFRANLSDAIDNMEGLDIQPQPDGSSLISLISDDNFNFIQNTLLLQFRLPADR